eukprot:GHVO01027803.1.p1 GENE.GHVO01027803.1~~GHVO01027803.1.p1  ORF type:complete len:115 (-),score=8.80 GHVO01027803.1:372-716(-)
MLPATGSRSGGPSAIRNAREQHQLMLEHQDDQLHDLALSADNLNQTALAINTELAEHQRMLSELDRDVDAQSGRMHTVMGKISKVFATSDTKQLCLILWLFVIFLILLFLVIYV